MKDVTIKPVVFSFRGLPGTAEMDGGFTASAFFSGRGEPFPWGWEVHAAGVGALCTLQVSASINSPEIFDCGLFPKPGRGSEDCLSWSSWIGGAESCNGPSVSSAAVLGLSPASWPVESSSHRPQH